MTAHLSELALGHGTWLAVCDGTTGLLLENKGDHAHPNLKSRDVLRHDNPPSHEQGSAPPGRSFNSVGAQRSSMEESDFHAQQAEAFLKTFAAHIDRHVREAGIPALVLIAPSRALGLIRKMLSDDVRRVLVGELDRDYVKLPLHEIEHHLARLD